MFEAFSTVIVVTNLISYVKTDYAFNRDLFLFTNRLNDGHTSKNNVFKVKQVFTVNFFIVWIPSCYFTYQSILPAPIIPLVSDGVESIFIAPDAVELFSTLGGDFADYLKSIHFDWIRLAGARVTEIQGRNPWVYVADLAEEASGTYLDHNVRINSVFTSYRISDEQYSQRLGDFAGPLNTEQDFIAMTVVLPNTSKEVEVKVPLLAAYIGKPFHDAKS